MAHTVKISGLTDELVQSIVQFSPASNKQAYRHARELASRGLRGHQYARTNQFEVDISYKGLDEKFRIKNRDDLADALQIRLLKLQHVTSKFKPEFLSLLLQLADRPLENTDVRALELLRPPSPPPPLTWSEILQEDPYSDDEIWKDIDYGAGSSDEEKLSATASKHNRSPPTSVENDDTLDIQTCLASADVGLAKALREAHFWNVDTEKADDKMPVTELQMIRETICMLRGLKTHLYYIKKHNSGIRIDSRFTLNHAMEETVSHLLAELTAISEEVSRLRNWVLEPTQVPLIQAFQAAIRKRLSQYDKSLSEIQQRHLVIDEPLAVSLIEVHDQVRSMSRPISRLARLLAGVELHLHKNPFQHLEALFEEVTTAQLTLEEDIFHYMSQVFFECLQPYLRPIQQWMEDGSLGDNDQAFFVIANDCSSDVSSLWHDRYVLRRDGQNRLCAPNFLHLAVKMIFDTGKSVVFLKELGIEHVPVLSEHTKEHSALQDIVDSRKETSIVPFDELLAQAFKSWIGARFSQASQVLTQHVLNTDQLMRVIEGFETIYLGKNGAVFESFAIELFERLDSRRRGWNDRYVLTEIVRTIYSSALCATDVERLVIRTSKGAKNTHKLARGLATISIDFTFPWSIQNIIQRSSIPIYQRVFTLLLQVYRVKYLLQSTHFQNHSHSKLRGQAAGTQMMRHRLTWFVDVFRSYLTEIVVASTMQQLRSRMLAAVDIDDMARVHDESVAKLQARCLLAKEVKPIFDALMEMLDLGVSFTQTAKRVGRDGSDHIRKLKSRRNAEVQPSSSDSEDNADGAKVAARELDPEHPINAEHTILSIHRDFERLLPFTIAGLKNIGRASAEPLLEQLAERLQWQGKKDTL